VESSDFYLLKNNLWRIFVILWGEKSSEKRNILSQIPCFLGEKRSKQWVFIYLFIYKIITITCNMKGCLDILFSYFGFCQIWLNISIHDHHLSKYYKFGKKKKTLVWCEGGAFKYKDFFFFSFRIWWIFARWWQRKLGKMGYFKI
jgi:hypothetical protein